MSDTPAENAKSVSESAQDATRDATEAEVLRLLRRVESLMAENARLREMLEADRVVSLPPAPSEFWRGIIAPKGEWDYEQVLRELHDYQMLLENVPKVYMEATNGRVSKPNTLAFDVIGEMQSARDEHIAEAVKEALEEAAGRVVPLPPSADYLTNRAETAPMGESLNDSTDLDAIEDMLDRAVRDTGREPQPRSAYDYLGRLVAEVRRLRALPVDPAAKLADAAKEILGYCDNYGGQGTISDGPPRIECSVCTLLRAALREYDAVSGEAP